MHREVLHLTHSCDVTLLAVYGTADIVWMFHGAAETSYLSIFFFLIWSMIL